MKTSAGYAGSAHSHGVRRVLLAAACLFAAVAVSRAGAAAAHDRAGGRFPAAIAATPEIPSIHARDDSPSLAERPDRRSAEVGEDTKYPIQFRRTPRRPEQREAWPVELYRSSAFSPSDAIEPVAPCGTSIIPAFGDIRRHQSRAPPHTAKFLENL